MDQLRNGTPNLSTSSSPSCSVRNLIEAVAKIRHQKQCATVVRIHKAVRQQLQRNIDVEEVIQQLTIATNSGALWRVDNNGVTSYREPPKGSSKEQVRWSQKESARWPNKETQLRSTSNNHVKYPLPDHVPYAVPDNNMFQQMADQFSWSEARRWTESVAPWNMPEPVRQHLGDPISWPMNEPLKRPINDTIPWASSDQYRLTVQESFPWPMPTEPFAWPVTEPWRQTMIEQFKRAEGSGNFMFENMNYRSLVDSSQKNVMNDPNQWATSDETSKQQKCSLPKDAFHSPRENQLGSMNASQNSNINQENMHSMAKQHKNTLGVCMVNQAFPDASVKNVPQVNVDLECNPNWYVSKGIPADQIMSFPVQERKDFDNSCSSPNNYLAPTFPTENQNSLQSSSNQHISSHFYEANEGPQAEESFTDSIQSGENTHSYTHAYLENGSMYCDDGTYKSVSSDETNKAQYHDQFDQVGWTNYPETSEQMQPSKVCFDDKLEEKETFIQSESNKDARDVDNLESHKTENKTEFASSSADAINCNDSFASNLASLSEKPPDLTILTSNVLESKCSDQNVVEDNSSPPGLGEPIVEVRAVSSVNETEDINMKSKESREHDEGLPNSKDCRKKCDNPSVDVCHHLKNAEGLPDLNDSVLKSFVSSNKLKSREAPLPILEKLTPQSLKSELSMVNYILHENQL